MTTFKSETKHKEAGLKYLLYTVLIYVKSVSGKIGRKDRIHM